VAVGNHANLWCRSSTGWRAKRHFFSPAPLWSYVNIWSVGLLCKTIIFYINKSIICNTNWICNIFLTCLKYNKQNKPVYWNYSRSYMQSTIMCVKLFTRSTMKPWKIYSCKIILFFIISNINCIILNKYIWKLNELIM